MNIVDEIKKEHDEHRAMIKKIQKAGAQDADDKRKTFSTLKRDVLAHMKAEEGTIIPEMLKIAELKPLAKELLKDHEEAREKFEKVKPTKDNDEWLSRFAPLAKELMEHMDKEEKEALEPAPKYFTKEQLKELGEKFEKIEKKEKGE